MISYLHAEALAAVELKHGTLALIEDDTPVIVTASQNHLLDKTTSNVQEVIARGAYVISIGDNSSMYGIIFSLYGIVTLRPLNKLFLNTSSIRSILSKSKFK